MKKPVELLYTDIVAAYEAAEAFTDLGWEVSKPREIGGKYCILLEG